MRSGTVSSSSTVLTRLRRETADAHTRVEDRLFPAALYSRASYARMLRAMLGLHAPLERQFRTVVGFDDLGIDLNSRRKADHLRADLSSLGSPVDPHAETLLPTVDLLLDSLPAALGAFYVLEGSTLGGRVLRTEVADRLGGVPTAFLDAYGAETGRRWRQTRAALVAAVRDSADPGATESALVDGAASTFSAFDRLLEAEGWALAADHPARRAREVPA